MVDNKLTIKLVDNIIACGMRKHIETKFHFFRDQVSNGKIILTYCRINDKLNFFLTKKFKIEKFKDMRNMLNITSV